MDITYHGHACFKIKGKAGTVVTDPYQASVGFSLPSLSADVVTVSHDHADHNAVGSIKATSRRERPFIIDRVGEYEVAGISVFGVPTFHDANGGVERGRNTVFTIMIDNIRICHLGDLGHPLSSQELADIGPVDVVLCPVGGVYTIDPAVAVKTIHSLEPAIAIPMHYQTPQHDPKQFSELKTLEDFLKTYGVEATPTDKLSLDHGKLPEETELVVLTKS